MSFFKEGKNINFALAGSDYIAKSKKTCEILNVEHVLLDNKELKERYPYIDIQEGRQCILQLSKAGVLNARRFVEAYKKAAEMQGCDVVDDIVDHMTEINQPDAGGADGGGCVLLELVTDTGRVIVARKVLVCTGAFTDFKSLFPAPPAFVRSPEQTLRVEVMPNDPQLQDMPNMSSFTRVTEDTDCYIIPPVLYPDGKYTRGQHARYCEGLLF